MVLKEVFRSLMEWMFGNPAKESLIRNCEILPEVQGILMQHPHLLNTSQVLNCACACGAEDVVAYLLSWDDIDPNAGSVADFPLLSAAYNGHAGVVQMLLTHPKTDPLQRTGNFPGNRAIDVCCWGWRENIYLKLVIVSMLQEAMNSKSFLAYLRSFLPSFPSILPAKTPVVPQLITSSTIPVTGHAPAANRIEKKFDVFLAHNWGLDDLGRDNHARVRQINEALQRWGLTTWFDEERMQGNMRDRMADGIAASKVVLIHVTQLYREKINSGDPQDHCYYEFNFTMTSAPQNVEVVVMEPAMKSTTNWGVRLRAELGTLLYSDLSSDSDHWGRKCDALALKIWNRLA